MSDDGKRPEDERTSGSPPPPAQGPAGSSWGAPPGGGPSPDPAPGAAGPGAGPPPPPAQPPPPPGRPPAPPGWGPPPGQGPSVGGAGERAGPGRVLPLRPLTVGDILDTAIRALRATFATAAVLVLLVHGPYQLLSSLALERLLPELGDPMALISPEDSAAALDLLVRLGSIAGVLGLTEVVVSLFVSLAVVWVVLRTDRDEPTSVGGALSDALRRAGATLGALLLVAFFGLVVAVPGWLLLVVALAIVPPLGVLLAIPAIPAFLLVALALVYLLAPIAVIERRGPWDTFTRAVWVVRRRFWRTIGVTVLMALLVLLLTASLGLAFGWLAVLSGPAGWVVDGIAGAIVSLVSVPLTAFAALLVYLDARVRLEGYDLELRARGLGPA